MAERRVSRDAPAAAAAQGAAEEARRVARLRELQLLDTAAEPMFDALARLASQVAGTPIALISLVDTDRQWFKANVGLHGSVQTPRAVAFCAHTICSDTLLEVPDATLDARFADNPLVTDAPGIRYYAGVPLVLAGGERIGTLCVVDRQPHRLSAGQRAQLAELGRLVVNAIELRERARSLDRAQEALERGNAELRQLYEQTPAMLHSIDLDSRLVTVSDQWIGRLGYRREEVLGRLASDFLTPASRDAVLREHRAAIWRTGRADRLSLQMVRKDGRVLDVLLSAVVQRDADGRPRRAVAVIEDVTDVLARAAELRREQAARRQIQRQAEELSRLADERSEMLDLLAHEVRQPLNNASAAIQSASAMLATRGEAAASARLGRAQEVLADVQGHVDNTLALSTLLTGTAAAAGPATPEEEADIDAVLDVAVAELPTAERGRVGILRLTAARTAVMDSALVRLALRNLLANAIRHTAPGTPVQLRVSDSEQPLALFIDVADHGAGLPAELLPRLFERGNRVRHADGRISHGLGLFIAHRALAMQGGELRLLHTGASGTAWRLVLPQGGEA